MTLHIIGAGMAGLLAANILRRQGPVVYEAQSELPDNHGALLRFRSDAVTRATGIPFRKVMVTKAVSVGRGQVKPYATLRDHNEYSYKVTGQVMARSILNLDPAERYIAPDTFIEDLARPVNILLNRPMLLSDFGTDHEPIISTIPMPGLMSMVGWGDKPDFKFREVWSASTDLPENIDVFQTIYFPDPTGERFYRASLTGNKLVMEYCFDIRAYDDKMMQEDVWTVLGCFGLAEFVNAHDLTVTRKHHKYGKLMPIDDSLRRAFILAMTDQHGIYSVGRFATWRQILLDDVVQDVHVVERFINERSAYSRRLHAGR